MKLIAFQVTNFRNIHDSGRIRVSELTAFVGQNESGKSNLCEALWKLNPADANAKYVFDEDWPADKWGNKDRKAVVCRAEFEETDATAIADLFTNAGKQGEGAPAKFAVSVQRDYQNQFGCTFDLETAPKLDEAKALA